MNNALTLKCQSFPSRFFPRLCVISMSSSREREREMIFILVSETDQMNRARVRMSLRTIAEFTFDSIVVIFL